MGPKKGFETSTVFKLLQFETDKFNSNIQNNSGKAEIIIQKPVF